MDYFNKYRGSTVFIIGGGPSTQQTDLKSIERDYTWSCNHFYLNEKIKKTKIDLAMIVSEPDTKSTEFLNYRKTFKPYIGFEFHDRWYSKEPENNWDDYDKYFIMHTRFYGRIGIGARMIIFASLLGCEKIIFTGFDGPEAILKGEHAFEPGKTTLPAIAKGLTKQQIHNYWKNQYDQLWKYLNHISPETKFKNIGGGKAYHGFNTKK